MNNYEFDDTFDATFWCLTVFDPLPRSRQEHKTKCYVLSVTLVTMLLTPALMSTFVKMTQITQILKNHGDSFTAWACEVERIKEIMSL